MLCRRLAPLLAVAALGANGGRARADDGELRYRSPPLLVAASLGFGLEPNGRATPACTRTMKLTGGGTTDVGVPQCNLILAYGVGAEVLWRGVVGAGAALYAAEGSPIIVDGVPAGQAAQPSFGDRVSIVVTASARPFGPLAWSRAGWGFRLLAGLGVQVGGSVEHARVSLDSSTTLGLHLSALLDVPVWRGNTEGGLSIRLQARLLVSRSADFKAGNTEVLEPGTAAQLFAGLVYYL